MQYRRVGADQVPAGIADPGRESMDEAERIDRPIPRAGPGGRRRAHEQLAAFAFVHGIERGAATDVAGEPLRSLDCLGGYGLCAERPECTRPTNDR